ncbi:MAG: methylmalonyl-CoA mutase family protein, partial [Planctomycetota bacterium]
MPDRYQPRRRIRIVTAASLFDGHDAAINIMRRILQRAGAEVIHLGHNRGVAEIAVAAVQEDAQAVAVTSYQGGHNEFFRYMLDRLRELDAGHVRVFGGGGGTIVPSEIEALETYGVAKIYSPEDGRRMGLRGMIDHLLAASDFESPRVCADGFGARAGLRAVASVLSQAEAGRLDGFPKTKRKVPVLGLTGPGGAGKSCLADEIVRRFLLDFPEIRVAVLSVDPSRKRGGGALLGDRIRMNAIEPERVFVRSFATRGAAGELSTAVRPALDVCRAAGYDVILVETSGIGQGDTGITDVADVSIYVMTPEYGAPSQLEKIDMLDYADLVALNKFDRPGAQDALRDVRKQVRRNRELGRDVPDDEIAVYGTVASRFNDDGVHAFFGKLVERIDERCGTRLGAGRAGALPDPARKTVLLEAGRERYLGEIARAVRGYHARTEERAQRASELYRLEGAARVVEGEPLQEEIAALRRQLAGDLPRREEWGELVETYRAEELVTRVRDQTLKRPLHSTSLSGTRIPRVVLPGYRDWGDRLRWLRRENVPGEFPYTAGVFHLRRSDEDPKRQFAGEGTPERTNKRYHYLCRDSDAHRLSVAFDSVTLYGEDPDERPDIHGKVGESGVSICTVEDMRRLFRGFDLCAPNT